MLDFLVNQSKSLNGLNLVFTSIERILTTSIGKQDDSDIPFPVLIKHQDCPVVVIAGQFLNPDPETIGSGFVMPSDCGEEICPDCEAGLPDHHHSDASSEQEWRDEDSHRLPEIPSLSGCVDPMFMAFWVQSVLLEDITESTQDIPKIFGLLPELLASTRRFEETGCHFTLLGKVTKEVLQEAAKTAFSRVNTLLPRMLICEEVLIEKGLSFTKLVGHPIYRS